MHAASRKRGAAGGLLDFGQNDGGFGFEGNSSFFVVALGKFTGAVFEFQIAQIFVDGVAALEELIEIRTVRRGIRSGGRADFRRWRRGVPLVDRVWCDGAGRRRLRV